MSRPAPTRARSARVSASSTLTVSAVSVSGRVARANSSARWVGLCQLGDQHDGVDAARAAVSTLVGIDLSSARTRG